METQIYKYNNGNAIVEIFNDGTRVVTTEDEDFKFEYPLNIDIRVSSRCPLGYNPETGKSVCEYCHESATTNGKECNYSILKSKLIGLPKGIELAIGGNILTDGLHDFLLWCKTNDYICNLTVNQLELNKNKSKLISYLDSEIIRGLGISYRKDYKMAIDDYFIKNKNVILHVIAGIDSVEDVAKLPFKKILILGYKKFGRGIDYYSPEIDINIQRWFWNVPKLFDVKDIVSFDNLSLKQLNIKRLLTDDGYNEINQGENSMYIDAVNGHFKPSSRSDNKTNWNNIGIKEYFKLSQMLDKDI